MSDTRKLKAEIIIEKFASGSGRDFSLASLIPGWGAIQGLKFVDENTAYMIQELGKLFYRDIEYDVAYAFYNHYFKANLGPHIAAGLVGIVPVAGSVLSAIFSDPLIQNSFKLVGWTAYFLMKDGKNIKSLVSNKLISEEELEKYKSKARKKI